MSAVDGSGADVRMRQGQFPLWSAADGGHVVVVRELLSPGKVEWQPKWLVKWHSFFLSSLFFPQNGFGCKTISQCNVIVCICLVSGCLG